MVELTRGIRRFLWQGKGHQLTAIVAVPPRSFVIQILPIPAPDREGGGPPVEQQPRNGGDAEPEPGGASGARGTEPRASAGGAAAEGADRS